MIEALLWATVIIGGFLLGGVMFCRILPQAILKKDVCELGEDKNPGAFNVFSSCGVVMGMICLLLDMLKGFLPVFIGYLLLDTSNVLFSVVIVAPVLGHAVGLFNHFHGGKCIATSFGVLIGMLPVTWTGWILAGVYILFSTLVKINSHRSRSIITFLIFGASSCIVLIVQKLYPIAVGYLLISAIAILKHSKLFDHSPATTANEQTIKDEDTPISENEN